MIYIQDYADMLETLGREYFIADIRYVPDLKAWAQENGVALSEPAQPLKLITEGKGRLIMVVQSETSGKALNGIITGLDVRWQVVDNRANLLQRFDSLEKQLAYCFLKEYARTKKNLAEDERLEDEWAIEEMEKLGFFEERVPRP